MRARESLVDVALGACVVLLALDAIGGPRVGGMVALVVLFALLGHRLEVPA